MTDGRCLHDESMRLQVLATARDWLGTPYRHQASLKGVGCDCLGLVRGIWRDIHGAEPETPPPYRPDWAERSGEDRLWDAATRAMGPPIDLSAMLPGDLILFRWRLGMPAKHAGILSDTERFIHAYEQASVVESALVPSWRRRIAGVFRFPEKV
ncbi:NlpC/P60 family protein [Rhizobium sp. PP-CC-3G-465]|uniref:NlpC/P60 family protein n=1 Tax=Rhizobium sp. PP-CC-3G-465 TaxID=2135648 RepID=UPI0010E07AFA|nr:NlpC/P60 family putative phage cell wall peptidase [Rhizobium sp. PP-CC-3G-465]